MKRLLSLALFLALSSYAKATTYFVNGSTGNNSNTCTSSGSPCLTLAGAQAKGATGGDTIVLTGNLNEPSTQAIHGTSSSSILNIQGYAVGGSCPTSATTGTYPAKGTRPNPTYSSNTFFTLNGNFVSYDCIKFTNAGISIPTSGQYITVANSTFDGTGTSTPGGTIFLAGIGGTTYANHITISDNYAVGMSNGVFGPCSNCLITRNEFSTEQGDEPGSDHDYIDWWGDGTTVISFNYMHGNTIAACAGFNCHMDCLQTFSSGSTAATGLIFNGNVCFNHHEGVINQNGANWTLTNNLFAYPPVGDSHPWCWIFENANFGTTLIQNNTCIEGTMGFRNTSGGSVSYKDNIFWTSGAAGTIYDSSSATTTGANNLYDSATGSFSAIYTGDVVNVSPAFVSTSSSGDLCTGCNFNLASTSSGAYNAGVPTSAAADWVGTSRPQSTAYDIGMFELPVTANVIVYTPPPTTGQPWFALKGFTHRHWAQPYPDAILAPLFAWTIPGSTIPTITANNNWSVSDFVVPKELAITGSGLLNEQLFYIATQNPTSFTLSGTNGSATGGTESSPAYIPKLNGTLTGTWSWTNTGTTPANVTLTSTDGLRTNTGTSPALTSEQSHIKIVFNTDGDCTETTTTVSTVAGNLIFTADADPSKTAVFPYVVCKPGANNSTKLARIYATTGYREAFKNDHIVVRSRVRGNSNRNVNWTITASPVGADGTLTNANLPHAIFNTGTVAGQYELTATAAVDGTVSDTAVIYVASQTRAAANPDFTEAVPCEPDPQASQTVWTVGSGKMFPDYKSVPLNAITSPTIVQIFNTGAPGSPSTYFNYNAFNFDHSILTTQPDVHHPLYVQCSVPNATSGEYPVWDGTNATGPTWINPFLSGKSIFFSINVSANQYFTNAPLPQKYVSITNMHVQHVNFGIPFTDPSGGAATWGDSSAVTFYNCEYCNDIGTWTNNVAIPIFVDANSANNNWGGGSFHIIHEGCHLQMSGSSGRPTEHPIYTQGQDDVIASCFIEGAEPGAQGASCWSSRAGNGIFEYNRCVPTNAATGGAGAAGMDEVQNFTRYLLASGTPGARYFGAGDPYANGDQWGPNGLAALIEEHNQSDLVYGNTIYIRNGEKTLGFVNTNGVDNQIDGPIHADVYYNTFPLDTAAYVNAFSNGLFELTRISSPGNGNPDPRPVVWPSISMANNIIPWPSNVGCNNQTSQKCYTIGFQDTDFIEFTGHNLVNTGQMNASGTVNQTYQGTSYTSGMSNDMKDIDYGIGLTGNPLNYRWKGFTAANFPVYTTYPIDTTTYAPVSGSAAIGIASTCADLQCLYPPQFNSVSATGVMTMRSDLTTVGAQDPPSGPPTTSIKVSGLLTISGNIKINH